MNKIWRKGIAIASISALLFAGSAQAGTSWKNIAENLPIFQHYGILQTDTKGNSSNAEAKISNIGSDYKANLRIYDTIQKKVVSSNYNGIDDNEDASFIVAHSAITNTVALQGQTANWSIVLVQISGHFRADSY